MSHRRVVFRQPVGPAEFGEFCTGRGWRYDGGQPAAEGEPAEYVWRTPDGVEVHWIDDNVLHLVYVLVIGEQPFDVEMAIRMAYQDIAPDEAVAEFAGATDWPDRVLALSLVAATAPEAFSQATFDAIAAGLADEHEAVRHKAVLATFYAPWRELLPALEKVAAGDPYQPARDTARIAVDTVKAG